LNELLQGHFDLGNEDVEKGGVAVFAKGPIKRASSAMEGSGGVGKGTEVSGKEDGRGALPECLLNLMVMLKSKDPKSLYHNALILSTVFTNISNTPISVEEITKITLGG